MKKIIVSIFVTLCTLCAYANTCNYENIRVTLQEPSVTVAGSQYGYAAWVNVTVNDTRAKEVRVLVQCGSQRREITVRLNNGSGMVNLSEHFNFKSGETYPVKLVNVPGMCF